MLGHIHRKNRIRRANVKGQYSQILPKLERMIRTQKKENNLAICLEIKK
jgi:hypothetical protein